MIPPGPETLLLLHFEDQPVYRHLPHSADHWLQSKIITSWSCFVCSLCQHDQTPLTVLVVTLRAKILSNLFHALVHLLPSICWALQLALTKTLSSSFNITSAKVFLPFSQATCFGLINRCLFCRVFFKMKWFFFLAGFLVLQSHIVFVLCLNLHLQFSPVK